MRLMWVHQSQQAVMRQRAEEMSQAARTATVRAQVMYTKAEASFAVAEQMCSGMRRTLDATRAKQRTRA